jgi:hypothetical protein
MKILLILSAALFFYTSCKKPVVESINLNNSRDSLTYQPKVPGSKWTYRRTIPVVGSTTYNFVRLNYDTTIGGLTYNVFSNDGDSYGNQYIRQDAGKYYSILVASTNKPPILVLDTAKNVNESWVGGVNGNDTYTFTMKQKIPTYTLDNFTFRNVLVIHQERTTTSGGNTTVTLSGDTYYAQGVGQVLSDGTVSSIPVNIKLITVDLK